MRAALYARFSSDLQSTASIADQLHACRRHAERIGATVSAEFTDAAISGASAANRPGLQALLAAAAAGTIDVVIAEALDRLTRSGGDAWDIFEDLRAAGVRIHTPAEGEVEELAIGLKGTMNALFLRELARKTRRGLDGVARDGRHAGGRTYGYRIRRELDGRGDLVRGLREIEPLEAEHVVEIFTRYAGGESPRAIAAALNLAGVPGPSGGMWNASTINGNAKRGNGVLHNELYRGVVVWGRHAWMKDRKTGKRRARAGDAETIVRQDVPALRIVDEALWAAVQARYALAQRQVAEGGRPGAAARPRGLLSGLVRCGECGGPMTLAGPDRRFLCSTRRERGPAGCANGRGAKSVDVEARVLEAIQRDLLHPEVIELAMREYHAAKAETQKAARGKRTAWERELGEVKRRADRLVDQVADGVLSGASVRDRLGTLEARRAELEQLLASADDAGDVVTLHPGAPARWRKLVEDLQAHLVAEDGAAERQAAREAFRALVRGVHVIPLEARGAYRLEIQTDLAPVLQNAKSPLAGADAPNIAVRTKMGAGTRSQHGPNGLLITIAA